jgi:hypothetical protein
MFVNKWVVGVCAGVAACGSLGAAAQSATLSVGKQSQLVQASVPSGSGISYVQTGSSQSVLQVYTAGYLLCSNVGQYPINSLSFSIAHEDLTLGHAWTTQVLNDVYTFNYNAGSLIVVPATPATGGGNTLACLGTSLDGSVPSGLSEGIFDNGYDSATQTNYSHLVNWIPSTGFSWLAPDWTEVPSDPCNPTADQPAVIDETVACAAATGVRGSVAAGGARAATAWTATDGINFTYLIRVDGRFGAQQPGVAPGFDPSIFSNVSPDGGATLASFRVIDSFDAEYLQSSGTGVQSCILTQLPASLTSDVCGSSGSPLSGNLSLDFSLGLPPLALGATSFYVAVTRPIVGSHQSTTSPVVALAVLTENPIVMEGGDAFSGDDIVFGFMPTSTGFPWMTGQ